MAYFTFTQLTEMAQEKDFKLEFPVFANFTTDLTLDNEVDPYKEDLVPFRCLAYHDNNNLNGSRINPDVFIDKTRSVKYRPVLANVITNDDGELDFGAHDFHFEEDENGNMKEVYDEQAIGIVTNYGFVEDESNHVTRAMVNGYLFGRYSEDAISIMKKKKRCDCSVELKIRDMHYDDETQRLVLDDYVVTGVTVLGSQYSPGMAGSQIALEDFAEENKLGTFQHLNEEEGAQLLKEVCDFLGSNESKKKVEDEQVTKDEETSEELEENPQESEAQDSSTGTEPSAEHNLQEELQVLKEENKDLKCEIEGLKAQLAEYVAQDLKKAKEEVLADPVYQPYLSMPEFKELVGDKNLSLEEFKIQAELAFAKCERKKILNAKTENFSKTQSGISSKKFIGVPEDKEKESRYGTIFLEGSK